MQLISTEDVVNAVNLNKFGGENMARIIMSVLQIDKINQLYANHYNKQPKDFLNSIINDIGINYSLYQGDLEKIPAYGPFVIVANHPFGGIEGVILLDCILAKRPDFKIIANFLFQRIEPIKEFVLAVNPFETHKHVKSSFSGLRYGMEHLIQGHPLGIFPAGEVSTYHKDSIGITDKAWNISILKFIKNAHVPVIPMYFHGKNSSAFYFMGRIHPLLRTVKLPSEMLNKKNTKIKLSIGNTISLSEQNSYPDIESYGQFLRTKTYALPFNNIHLEPITPVKKRSKSIHNQDNPLSLINEIRNISEKYILFKWQEYTVFCTPVHAIPVIIKEIGRLREITFREVGEGTNKSLDLDKYDAYYDQLFIWNEIENEIVGGYRLGKGYEILPERGIKGFYTNTLFHFENKTESIFSQCVELGRSFVVSKYQRKPWSLFLLWKGIFYFINKNKQCRYLLGPVSISNNYKLSSKQLMVAFIEKYFYNNAVSANIKPRNPFVSTSNKETMSLLDDITDLNALDRIIRELESSGLKMPVLLKKYLNLGGEIIGFNMDPKFNNCLDCLLILDFKKIPADFIDSLSKDKEKHNQELVNS